MINDGDSNQLYAHEHTQVVKPTVYERINTNAIIRVRVSRVHDVIRSDFTVKCNKDIVFGYTLESNMGLVEGMDWFPLTNCQYTSVYIRITVDVCQLEGAEFTIHSVRGMIDQRRRELCQTPFERIYDGRYHPRTKFVLPQRRTLVSRDCKLRLDAGFLRKSCIAKLESSSPYTIVANGMRVCTSNDDIIVPIKPYINIDVLFSGEGPFEISFEEVEVNLVSNVLIHVFDDIYVSQGTIVSSMGGTPDTYNEISDLVI